MRTRGVAGVSERQVQLPCQDGRLLPLRGPAPARPPPSCRGPAASRRPLPLVLGPGGCGRRPGARALGSDGQRRKWSVETEAWRVSGPLRPRGARSDPRARPRTCSSGLCRACSGSVMRSRSLSSLMDEEGPLLRPDLGCGEACAWGRLSLLRAGTVLPEVLAPRCALTRSGSIKLLFIQTRAPDPLALARASIFAI